MNKHLLHLALVAGVLTLTTGLAGAAPRCQQEMHCRQERCQTQDRVCDQLLSQEQRQEFCDRMQAAQTVEEQEQIRREHHASMKAEAEARGLTLPDEPPARGAGMGAGCGCRHNQPPAGGR